MIMMTLLVSFGNLLVHLWHFVWNDPGEWRCGVGYSLKWASKVCATTVTLAVHRRSMERGVSLTGAEVFFFDENI